MNLGERIYQLRTKKNLSQGDLAEMLEVSRQSVSKWENNNAVPELEKIIKLSEIFEVSLDVLIKGEDKIPKSELSSQESIQTIKEKESVFPGRKLAGTILLCMAFFVTVFFMVFGAGFAGLIFAIPFLVCGIICFVFKKHVGLWCAWTVYFLFDIYMAYATGISRGSVFYTLQWTHQMNYMRLVFAWVLLLSLMAMIAISVIKLGKQSFQDKKKGRIYVIVSWGIFVVLQAISMIFPYTEYYQYLIENIYQMQGLYRLIYITLGWARIIAVTIALVNTLRLKTRKS